MENIKPPLMRSKAVLRKKLRAFSRKNGDTWKYLKPALQMQRIEMLRIDHETLQGFRVKNEKLRKRIEKRMIEEAEDLLYDLRH